MPILVTPEVGIPFPFDTTPDEIEDFRRKAHAYFNTISALEQAGLEVTISDEDRRQAHTALSDEQMPSERRATPGMVKTLEAILTEWDYEILDAKRKLRNYVTNKLVIESENTDPKIRLRALELLGKTSAVGLFSDKLEVNITTRTAADIEADIKKTLELCAGDFHEVVDEELDQLPSPAKISVADLDLDAELGPQDG